MEDDSRRRRSLSKSPALFGDYFGQRADYSVGLFYSGHRKFLNNESSNALEPPDDYKTKRQLRRSTRESQSRSDAKFHVNFQQKKYDDYDYETVANKKRTKIAPVAKDVICIEKYSSYNPEDWIEERQAGVRLWINKNTGEVSSECPWQIFEEDSENLNYNHAIATSSPRMATTDSSSGVPRDRIVRSSEDREEEFGTGALVYDGSELEELFSMLEGKTKISKK